MCKSKLWLNCLHILENAYETMYYSWSGEGAIRASFSSQICGIINEIVLSMLMVKGCSG